ncbi:hypothetical protein BHE74_00001424 [Ensete ventricosum]|nr:hypothetical protein GW17_00022716 [Ensete ventricosum]RWW89576.1 hypothetical protein BHE74_00001424 [Ensete ventricosum]
MESMEASLQHTPTWAAATIFFFAVAASYGLAQSISFAGNVSLWFRSHQKIALSDAIDKLKEGEPKKKVAFGFRISIFLRLTDEAMEGMGEGDTDNRVPRCKWWQRCFFRQFYDSVNRVDYLTLRHGFIMVRLRFPACR